MTEDEIIQLITAVYDPIKNSRDKLALANDVFAKLTKDENIKNHCQNLALIVQENKSNQNDKHYFIVINRELGSELNSSKKTTHELEKQSLAEDKSLRRLIENEWSDLFISWSNDCICYPLQYYPYYTEERQIAFGYIRPLNSPGDYRHTALEQIDFTKKLANTNSNPANGFWQPVTTTSTSNECIVYIDATYQPPIQDQDLASELEKLSEPLGGFDLFCRIS